MKREMRNWLRRAALNIPFLGSWAYGYSICKRRSRGNGKKDLIRFILENNKRLHVERYRKDKQRQIARLLRRVDICPVENDTFFYSIDCYKGLNAKNRVLDNYSVDYGVIVNSSFSELAKVMSGSDAFGMAEMEIIGAMEDYYKRCMASPENSARYEKQLAAIGTLFSRPAESLFEGLQRILFYDQFLWQTGHALNGLGHLDWILGDLYRGDLAAGVENRESAKKLLKDFLLVLHAYYWFKSASLTGDTGQIIILGGMTVEGEYRANDLTYLFLEVSEELHLPDPKVLLRCASDMPEGLLGRALDCIATGIGAPLLSNDDVVVPAMMGCGYAQADAFEYATAACWEPLVPGVSSDANNIASLNFAVPFVRMCDGPEFEELDSLEAMEKLYERYLSSYICGLLTPLTELVFEEDPLLSLVSSSALDRRKDITRGGAKYNNLGLTSVGLGTAINSLLNLEKLVFSEKRYTLAEINGLRKADYSDQDDLLQELRSLTPCFGCDDSEVIGLTKTILSAASEEFKKYRTKYGGVFKFGLSSPGYISGAKAVAATFDGRRSGDPFSVHISSQTALPTTELLSFAMQLDYGDNRLNGNVVDFITSPGMLQNNKDKYISLIGGGIAGGIFQLQMNVVDSKTLIAAKADPSLFPGLVVRVWGFSAYFNDLPEEYKDVLIARAIESEKAA